MSLRFWNLVSVSLLVASALGCAQGAAGPAEGRLDLVIRPDGMAASSRPVQGSFSVRSLDRAGVERVRVGSANETRSVALRAGSYAVEWQPALSLEDPGTAPTAEAPRAIVIAAGQVTTLNVRVSFSTSAEAQLAALDLAPRPELYLESR